MILIFLGREIKKQIIDTPPFFVETFRVKTKKSKRTHSSR